MAVYWIYWLVLCYGLKPIFTCVCEGKSLSPYFVSFIIISSFNQSWRSQRCYTRIHGYNNKSVCCEGGPWWVCVSTVCVSGDPSRSSAVNSQGGEVLDLPQSCELLIGPTSQHTTPHISSSNWIAACHRLICIRPAPPPHLRQSASDCLALGFPAQHK